VRRTIVIGVDGSPSSVPALRWAADEARRVDGTVLRVIMASEPHYPMRLLDPAVPPATPLADFELEAESARVDRLDAVAEAEAELTMNKMLADVDLRGSSVTVETLAICGQPAKVLLDAAANADLLVVGSRGRSGFTGLLLGSVSAGVAHHARCPVVIVPHDYDEARSR
jgi:nucleotide-binding universal stress UspA family protein